MKFKYCLEKGLIKRDNKAKERIPNSIETAERFLKSANKTYKIQEYELAEISAYNSIFHSFRGLLFNKNYLERSHFCLFTAIKELYKDDKEIADKCNIADRIRLSRHNIQYGGILVNKEEINFVLKTAEEILGIAKRILLGIVWKK
ncbi:MAG: HEPN domain-containing protein [Candidatus Aenigmarchaeota archaeon]|nr:HEPN domain-containing protein [Candidatus Aenigmarchaeota archaeon]